VSASRLAPRTSHPGLVPELGPALGRLTALPGAPVGAPPAPRVELSDIRLAMVGRIFDVAASARGALDGDGAAEILSPERLRAEWDRAAGQVADRTIGAVGAALLSAGVRSGVGGRLLKRAALSKEEGALLRARLLGAGVPFIDGLTALDVAETGSDEWREAVIASMRRLETAWLAMEQRALVEERAWDPEVRRLAEWRPSPWPRRIVASVVVVVCLYAGLVLGGYLPVPPGGEAVTAWWWAND
jgi:hypothetical protein